MSRWIALNDRKYRPSMDDLAAFWPSDVMALFTAFANHMARAYGLHCKPPVYTQTHGWTIPIGRSVGVMFGGVVIEDDGFRVEGVAVRDEATLSDALDLANRLWEDGFGERLAALSAEHSARQTERARLRRERERGEVDALSEQIDAAKFNRYRWSPKVSRRALALLYENDARGVRDEELADEVGFTLYARCLQGRDERLLIESGRLKCHGCGNILPGSRALMTCSCGRQYLFRDYMRSFRTDNMPSGAATAIFNRFIEDWERAKTYEDKVRHIDALVHEFHINLVSGVKGRFVGVNLIEGTKKQIEQLILALAYGDATAASRDAFARNLKRQ